jgi:hypothetical protein
VRDLCSCQHTRKTAAFSTRGQILETALGTAGFPQLEASRIPRVLVAVGGREAEGGGLLNADQHFGHRRFSSQVLAFQSLSRFSDLAAVGSGSLVLGAGEDNSRDSLNRVAPINGCVIHLIDRACAPFSSLLAVRQIGNTCIGILSGSIGETFNRGPCSMFLERSQAVEPCADPLSPGILVVLLTYCSFDFR